MTSQIIRRLEQLEQSMGAPDGPRFDIEIVFVQPDENCPGGRITRTIRLSELTDKKGGRQ